jgi:hypothetical protein
LQQQTIMLFIIMQQLTMPPCSMVHRFCIMLHAILSSQEHEMRIPPWHFSNFSVQRGTIIQLAGIVAGLPITEGPMLAVPIPALAGRSIIMLVMTFTPLPGKSHAAVNPNGDAGMIFRKNPRQDNGPFTPRQAIGGSLTILGRTSLSNHD